jgi:hypothetical protein
MSASAVPPQGQRHFSLIGVLLSSGKEPNKPLLPFWTLAEGFAFVRLAAFFAKPVSRTGFVGAGAILVSFRHG